MGASGKAMKQSPPSSRPVIAVTGASGFIGTATTRELVAQGNTVRVAVRNPESAPSKSVVEPFSVDMDSVESLARFLDGVDTVVHLAGAGSPSSAPSDFGRVIDANVLSTRCLLEAIGGASVSRLVAISSSAVYGRVHADALSEDMPVKPTSVYGSAKLMLEQLVGSHASAYELSATCLRVFNVYGVGLSASTHRGFLLPQLIRNMLNGTAVRVRGNGLQTRDFVHVDDVARVIGRACNPDVDLDPVMNVGSGQPTTVKSMVEGVARRLNVNPKVCTTEAIPGEVEHVIANTLLMERRLGMQLQNDIEKFIEGLTDEQIALFGQA